MQFEGLDVIREDHHGEGESESENPHRHSDAEERVFRQLALVSRAVVVFVLAVSAATTARLAFKILRKDEVDDFSTTFSSVANEVIQLAANNGEGIFLGAKSFASLYYPWALATGQELPFVTISHWEAMMADARAVIRASSLHYFPMIQSEAELAQWNNYSAQNTEWIKETRYHSFGGKTIEVEDRPSPFVFSMGEQGVIEEDFSNGMLNPMWQYGPVSERPAFITNYNAARVPMYRAVRDLTLRTKTAALSAQDFFARENRDTDPPSSMLVQPITNGFPHDEDAPIVAHLVALIPWSEFFSNVLAQGQEVYIVVQSCESNSTFKVVGTKANFIGLGDKYEGANRNLGVTGQFINSTDAYEEMGGCRHKVHVFPSDSMKEDFLTSKPTIYAIVIVSIFFFSCFVFIVYDFFVTNRQKHTQKKAETSSAIVQELFPGNVAAKLYSTPGPAGRLAGGTVNDSGSITIGQASIADFYPAATVLFADISGFTAWSSTRDPQQVFMLLEAIFQGFDACAKRLAVFKVETIGDCYVAVCGVPKANRQHSVVMCRFARDALSRFKEIICDLELTLGPDTGDLSLRVGLHSGPVTAGVLRGDRARFQLFGDTVNTSSRMESCGQPGRIHLSEETAKELVKHGKMDWLTRREDQIEAKGKGKLTTYWLTPTRGTATTSSAGESDLDESQSPGETMKTLAEIPTKVMKEDTVDFEHVTARTLKLKQNRLIEWNTELLMGQLKRVVARRKVLQFDLEDPGVLDDLAQKIPKEAMAVDAVQEVIEMPTHVFDGNCSTNDIDLGTEVQSQLRNYVSHIASMYSDENAFHNFEHASHVAMSVNKLLSRIVNPDCTGESFASKMGETRFVHQQTLGLSSDPLTIFSCVLASLSHDVGHRGLTNFDLAKEDPLLDKKFQGKSIAEQNSVDIAWSILLLPDYASLRRSIFATTTELNRFRSLLVNSLIATDIFDKELASQRRCRWERAFNGEESDGLTEQNRKATIVIEHLIQASDVVHTMQHWHIYRKWNNRLFNEMFDAFRSGRSARDPSLGWYEGELAFFDKYVIPLAQKLKDCCVFGVSSDEYLNYALLNREEWREKGKAIVEDMKSQGEKRRGSATTPVPTEFML